MKEQENLESAGHYDRYDLGTMVVCIKPYGKLSEGSHYQIDGCGSLDLNMDPRRGSKSGFGFSVKYESYDFKARAMEEENYYFTVEEMPEYFITEEEDYVAHRRQQRIGEIVA